MYISIIHLFLFFFSVSMIRVLILYFLSAKFFNVKRDSVRFLFKNEFIYLCITIVLSSVFYIVGLLNQSSEYDQIVTVIMGLVHALIGVAVTLIRLVRNKINVLKILFVSSLLFIIPIVVGFAVHIGMIFILKQAGFERFRIEGFSMEPEYPNDINLLVKRSPKAVDQFDPVLVTIDDRILMSRIVAQSGDAVVITSEDIFVNQERIPTVPPTRIFKDLTANNQLMEGPRVYVTDEGIGIAIKRLQDISRSSSSSGEVLEILEGNPNHIAIENGWFRADDNARDISIAESISPVPGSYITWVHDPIVTYHGTRDHQFPYETSLETRLELIEPLRQPSNEIVIFIDTDSGAFSYEKTPIFNKETKATQFILEDGRYLILNDQRYTFITDEPWQIISKNDIYGKVISQIGLYNAKGDEYMDQY